jgi:hypothetical protein
MNSQQLRNEMMFTDSTVALVRHSYQTVKLPMRFIEDFVSLQLAREGRARSLYRWAVGPDEIGGDPRPVDDLTDKRNKVSQARLKARELAELEAMEEAWAATRDRMRATCELAQEERAAAVRRAHDEAARIAATAKRLKVPALVS